jgi:uncharacterized protein (TIGR03435 family)
MRAYHDGFPVCTGRTIPGTITAAALSMSSLAGSLVRFVDRVVIDETGLTGYYDYELKWTPDQIAEPRPGPLQPVRAGSHRRPRVMIRSSRRSYDIPLTSADSAKSSPYARFGFGFASSTYIRASSSMRRSTRA